MPHESVVRLGPAKLEQDVAAIIEANRPHVVLAKDRAIFPPITLTGAPPAYRPEFCQLVIDELAKGYSLGGFAGLVGVDRATVNRWIERYPAFRTACATGSQGKQRFWEGRLIDVAETGGRGSQGQVAIFGVLNSGREDWRNRTEIEHSGTVSLAAVVDRMFAAIDQRKTLTQTLQDDGMIDVTPAPHVAPIEDGSDCF